MMQWFLRGMFILMMGIGLVGCDELLNDNNTANNNGIDGETARVVNVIDGDTIDVVIDGIEYRVRYVGVNTPERDESCYRDATQANEALVAGKTVTLVRDTSDTDRFDRLLRYIYVGDTFVNETLVREGWAESVRYDPDDRYYTRFVDLERQASADGAGCHPTGIFEDGTNTR